ncbi:MAG: YdcF family protein [Oscillospiraceae bacterium]|nr:YdcF family protein [Oscillospiraceae bacterium]
MKKPLKLWRALRLIVIIIVIIAMFAAAFALIVNYVVIHTAEQHILTTEQAAGLEADCVLVLGAGVWNGKPSPMLSDRLDYGIELYFSGAGKKLLLSGDHGQISYDEVNVMRDYALEAGVPAADIFMDHAGFSTYESMYRALEVFQVDSVVVVTQEYHLYRAVYVARSLGLDAVGVASDPRQYTAQFYRDAREILARNKDFFYCVFKPLPTFLGEAIPIWGDGNLTLG